MQQLLTGQVLGTDRTDICHGVRQLRRGQVRGARGTFRMCDMCPARGVGRWIAGLRRVLTGAEAGRQPTNVREL